MREAGPIGKARLRRTFGPPPPGFASILIESLVPHFSSDFPYPDAHAARLLATVHQRGGCCEAGCTCLVVVFSCRCRSFVFVALPLASRSPTAHLRFERCQDINSTLLFAVVSSLVALLLGLSIATLYWIVVHLDYIALPGSDCSIRHQATGSLAIAAAEAPIAFTFLCVSVGWEEVAVIRLTGYRIIQGLGGSP